jgi:hypothetical protein
VEFPGYEIIIAFIVVQRYLNHVELTIDFQIQYPGHFMERIKKTGNKQLSTLEPMKM